MVPKMEACLRAVRGGVAAATSSTAGSPHSILLEIFTDEGIGTMVVPEDDRTARAARPSAAALEAEQAQ